MDRPSAVPVMLAPAVCMGGNSCRKSENGMQRVLVIEWLHSGGTIQIRITLNLCPSECLTIFLLCDLSYHTQRAGFAGTDKQHGGLPSSDLPFCSFPSVCSQTFRSCHTYKAECAKNQSDKIAEKLSLLSAFSVFTPRHTHKAEFVGRWC